MDEQRMIRRRDLLRGMTTASVAAAAVAAPLMPATAQAQTGVDKRRAEEMINKFWPEGLLIVQAGGQAGLFSAICAGWTGGRFRDESKPVTREIKA